MMKNMRGFTLFELLVTLSVGSVVVMMLMGVLTNVLLVRTHIETANRIDETVYNINSTLLNRFEDLGYRSIMDLEPESDEVDNDTVFGFLIAKEYEIVIDGSVIIADDSVKQEYVLLMDIGADQIYYGPRDQFILGIGGDPIEDNRNQYVISSPRLLIHEGSTMEHMCLREHNPDIVDGLDLNADCAKAMIEFDLDLSYELQNGNIIDRRTYVSTLFY